MFYVFLLLTYSFAQTISYCDANTFWNQTGGTCTTCPTNCASCWSATKCTSCKPGFYLDQNYNCQERADIQHCVGWDGLYCVECADGYYISQMKCDECTISQCSKCTSAKCFKCKEGYTLYEPADGPVECIDCADPKNDEKCGRCPLGKYFDTTSFTCKSCRENCSVCTTATNCYLCVDDLALSEPSNPLSTCDKIANCKDGYYYGNHCELCKDQYYVLNGYCSKCGDSCKRCINSTECVECNTGSTLSNGVCTTDSNCVRSSSVMGCIECKEGYFLDSEGRCEKCSAQCGSCLNSTYCFRCAENYYFTDVTNGVCEAINTRTCNVGDQYGCLQCKYDVLYDQSLDEKEAKDFNVTIGSDFKLGYYINYSIDSNGKILNESQCKMCNPACRICEYNASWCTGCNPGYWLVNDTDGTKMYSEIFGVSSVTIFKCVFKPDICEQTEMGYCIKCDSQHFLQGVECLSCDISCDTCVSDRYCQTCNGSKADDGNAYYWRKPSLNAQAGEAKQKCLSVSDTSTNTYLNCSGPITTTGCSDCYDRYYLNDGECLKCPDECYNCKLGENNEIYCTGCKPATQYLGKDNKCYECGTIEHCSVCGTRGCDECGDGYSVSADRTECKKVNLALIIPLVVVGLFIIFVIIGVVAFLVWRRRRKVMAERATNIQPFKVNCDVEMALLSADNANFPLKTNKWELKFGHGGQKVKIDTPYEETIQIMNPTNKSYFFEMLLGASHKYEITAEPMRFTLKPEYAVEIKVVIKLLCTSVVSEEIGIVAMDMDEEFRETAKVSILMESDISSKLDHSELKLVMPAIGEGAFGMVFRGTYRGREVAVKKMKARTLTEEQEKEFNHEVNMLTQLRHACIVSFVGAVYTEGEISIVTEFAEFGSLSKIWNRNDISKISFDLKVKFMEDAVVALAFLHKNQMIHRDVKGENILIYSLNPHSSVCGKLTDFGTCRSISERSLQVKPLTQGIGTPTYMAPECLFNADYSYPFDVYAFAMVLYETFTEKQAYENDERFGQPWMIPQFVIDGKRLERPDGMPDNYWDLIEKCWVANAEERPSFEQIYSTLSSWDVNINHTDMSGKESNSVDNIPQPSPPEVTNEPNDQSNDEKDSKSHSSSSSAEDENE